MHYIQQHSSDLFFLMIRRPPRSTLFPYTRSSDLVQRIAERVDNVAGRPAIVGELPELLDAERIDLRILACVQIEDAGRSEEHTSELQSQSNLVCRLLLEKKKKKHKNIYNNTTCHN